MWFLLSYVILSVGIALSNRCGLPIVPTDLFPRELSDITKVGYPKIKIAFDVTCLAVTTLKGLVLALSLRRSRWARRSEYAVISSTGISALRAL